VKRTKIPAVVIVVLLLFLAILAIGILTNIQDSLLDRAWPWIALLVFLIATCCLFIRHQASLVFCATLLGILCGESVSRVASHSFYIHDSWAQQAGHWLVPALLICLFIWFTFGARSRHYFTSPENSQNAINA